MEIDWRGYELRPDTHPGGRSLTELYGPRATSMQARVLDFAKEFGIAARSVRKTRLRRCVG